MFTKKPLSLLFGFIFFLIMNYSFAQDETKELIVEKGSWATALLNRGRLRSYAKKISDRSITPAEVRDYVSKGGSVNHYKSYDLIHNFFVSPFTGSILNYFIDGGKLADNRELPVNRLESLEILLNAGASPNTKTKSDAFSFSDMPPILLASAGNDIEALKILLKFNADLSLTETTYTGLKGPAISLATDEEVVKLLIENGADPKQR